MRRNDHYVDKQEMYAEIVKYHDTGIISDELGVMFMNIAIRCSSSCSFCNYTYRDEMISSSIERMVAQISKFDIHRENANPFAYFTQITYMQFLTVLKREKKQSEIRTFLRRKVWNDLCENESLPFVEEADPTLGLREGGIPLSECTDLKKKKLRRKNAQTPQQENSDIQRHSLGENQEQR